MYASATSASVGNLARISHATDSVFGDGTLLRMADMSGDMATGCVADLTVGVSL